MNLRFFFKHEAGASAFLASLLEQHTDFRDAFFEELGPLPGVEGFKLKDWRIDVEVSGIDIRLDATDGTAALLIENKVRAASAQSGQLKRYYEEEMRRVLREERQHCRIGIIYVTPGPNLGSNELEQVECSIRAAHRTHLDFVARLSWPQLEEMGKGLRGESEDFIRSGFSHILTTIHATARKWSTEGDRGIILQMANRIREQLLSKQSPPILIGNPWPGKDFYCLATGKTNLTMWLNLRFTAKEEPPHQPKGWRVNGDRRLRLECMLKLSGVARQDPDLKHGWEKLLAEEPHLEFPHIGRPSMRNGWLVAEGYIEGSPGDLVEMATAVGIQALEIVSRFGFARSGHESR